MYVSFVGRVSQAALPSFLMATNFKRYLREAFAGRDYGGGIHGLVITVDSLNPESGLSAVPRKARKQRNTRVRDESGTLTALPSLYEAGVVVDEKALSNCQNERQVIALLVHSISEQAELVLGNLKDFDSRAFVRDLNLIAG